MLTTAAIPQIALLLAECLLIALCIVAFYRLRTRFGLALLYVTIGGFQYMQTVLATSIYIEIAPGILVSPGSAVLFTGSLFAILLVYIRDGTREARVLIYGLVAANVSLSIFAAVVGRHLASPLAHNFLDLPASLFLQDLGGFILGTALLIFDVVLLIVLYELVSQKITGNLFLRIYVSMAVILAFDATLFTTSVFWGEPEFQGILVSGLVAKLTTGLVYSLALWAYLTLFEREEFTAAPAHSSLRGIFKVLTYRERYDLLRQAIVRDPMTGLYNRGFFDDTLAPELARAAKSGHDTSLLLVDLDHFKAINDTLGHQAGDEVIVKFANAMQASLRVSDLPCRYGGEEFAVILPDADAAAAVKVAENIRRSLMAIQAELPGERPVTVTIGIASFPDDAHDPQALLRLADERLYDGKRAGRDRIVAGVPTLA